MNDTFPRGRPRLADPLALLREARSPVPRPELLERALARIDRTRIARASVRRAGEDGAIVASLEGATADAPARGAPTDPAVLELRERDRVAFELVVEPRARLATAEVEELELFAAALSTRLTERSHALQADLAAAVAGLGEGDAGVAGVAEAILRLLLPRLGAPGGAIVAAGAVEARVLSAEGLPAGAREALLARRTPFGEGPVWRACLDGAPRRVAAEALPDVAVPEAGPIVAYPLGGTGPARWALVVAYPAGEAPTEADVEVVAGVGPALAGALAASRDHENHGRILDFQFRALTQRVDDLVDAILALAVDVVPGAECGSLLVRDEEDGTYAYRACDGFDLAEVASVRFTEAEMRAWYDPTGEGRTGPRLVSGDAGDLDRHARAAGNSDARIERTRVRELRANLCVPIRENGRPVAYLNLDHRRAPGAFGEDSLRATERYAAAAASLLVGAIRREQAREEAVTDPLTGLLNRRGFDRGFERVRHEAERENAPFTVLVMDLHGFKRVNDRLGHEAGDAALRRVARALSREARKRDVLARWGGDEFVAVLPDVEAEEATLVAARLRALVGALDLGEEGVGLDVGASAWPRDGREARTLLQVADERMYAAKRERRGESRAWPYDDELAGSS